MEKREENIEEGEGSTPHSDYKRVTNVRIKESTGKDIKDENKKIGDESLKFEKDPKYLEERLNVFKEVYER
jgi:hypothetical protein